ncbi:MAG: DUF4872 domain-containing protein [Anaerolineae bacterium]
MPTLKNYQHFGGLHWETGFLVNIFAYQGIRAPHTGKPISEALLMGVNGGLCAGYFAFDYQGFAPHLHFLTRYPFNMEDPGAMYERLAIPRYVQQTPNPQKGVANVINALAQGQPPVVWGDGVHFPYNNMSPKDDFWMVAPFVVFGCEMEGDEVLIADRACVPLKVTTEQLAAARARIAKTKHRMMTVGAPDFNRLPNAVREGIRACVKIFVDQPPVGPKSSFGFDAYKKWADLLTSPKGKQSWSKMFAPGGRMYAGLTSTYRYVELFFTGGRGARGIYADFLDEAALILSKPELKEAAAQFRLCAQEWDALMTAVLPDAVPPFKETRELMRRKYELFLARGGDSLAERQQLDARLDAIRQDMDSHFPLTDAEAAALRATLRDHVMRVHDAEVVAIDMLQSASV